MEKQTYTVFIGEKLLIQGPLKEVLLKVKKKSKEEPDSTILIFSDLTGKQMDFDLRGTEKEILQRLEAFLEPKEVKPQSGPGRPKMGVVAREISLLPRHWEWLAAQPGGASAAIRRLVDDTRKTTSNREQIKLAQEATHSFMTSMAGNLPHYEEALRSMYAKDKKKFKEFLSTWPDDIRTHVLKLSYLIFES